MDNGKDYSISFVRFIAMILIIICHIMQMDNFSTFIMGRSVQWAFWFNVGVQIFLFLSGFLHGRREKIEIIPFYKKVSVRILVDYYIFAIISILVYSIFIPSELSLVGVFKLLTVSGTIKGLEHLWYITTIMFCYLLSPILIELIKDSEKRKNQEVYIVAIIIGFYLLIKLFFKYFNSAYICCYFMGMIFYRIKEKKNLYKLFAWISVFSCFILVGLQIKLETYYVYQRSRLVCIIWNDLVSWAHVFLGIVIFLFLSYLYNKGMKKFTRMLDFTDRYSYDIYIVHHVFIQSPFACVIWIENRLIAIPLAIVLSIVFAILLNKMSFYAKNRFNLVHK